MLSSMGALRFLSYFAMDRRFLNQLAGTSPRVANLVIFLVVLPTGITATFCYHNS